MTTDPRAIIDAGTYLTLATIGPDGAAWPTPVYFAAGDHRDFYWMSSPETMHSRNLAHQPRVSAVIFDTAQGPGTVSAVWMTGRAGQIPDADLAAALAIYPGSRDRAAVGPDQVRGDAPYRLYRARMDRYWTMCPRGAGPCDSHGSAFDHRIEVRL